MPIQLKFIGEDGNPIDINQGIDLGTSRRGVANIKKFKVRNDGDITAKDLVIVSEPYNNKDEVSEQEYNNQVKASKWKTYSLKQNGEYSNQLNLGNVAPSGYVEGDQAFEIDFTNSERCLMKDVWTAGTTEFRLGEMRFKKLDNTSKGQIAKRIGYSKGNECRDLNIAFKCEFNTTTEGQETSKPFFGVPVRINSNGDERGYMFIMHFDRNNSRISIAIHKGAKGMVDNMNRDYGTKKFQIVAPVIHNPNKEIIFKVYNNKQGFPTFEVLYDGKNLELMDSSVTSIRGNALSDKSGTTYKNKGKWYGDLSLYDGDFYLALKSMRFTTEEEEAWIYMRSYLEDDAEDKVSYKCATLVGYIEE